MVLKKTLKDSVKNSKNNNMTIYKLHDMSKEIYYRDKLF
jgi:hypothetical protein